MDECKLTMRIEHVDPQTQGIADQIASFRMVLADGPMPEALESFTTGQYVVLSLPGVEGAYFSMASAPEDRGYLEFLVKRAPGMAEALFQQKVGDTVLLEGPMGKGFPVDRHRGKSLLLIGAGTALAPLRSVLRSVNHRRKRFQSIDLYYSVLTPEHLCYRSDLEEWSQHRIGAHAIVTHPDAGWDGLTGFTQEHVARAALDPKNTVALVVGMRAMMEANIALLRERGFPEEHILLNY